MRTGERPFGRFVVSSGYFPTLLGMMSQYGSRSKVLHTDPKYLTEVGLEIFSTSISSMISAWTSWNL